MKRFSPPGADAGTYVFTTNQGTHSVTPDEIAREEHVWWTVQSGTPLGAWFLMYVGSPIMSICWLGRTLSGAHKPEDNPYSVAWVELVELTNPVPLSEVRTDPVAGAWSSIAGGANLQGSSRRVKQPDVWDRMIELILQRNPDVMEYVTKWLERPPEPVTEPLDDYFWPGWNGETNYPFKREAIMQHALHDRFLADGYTPPSDLRLPAMEARLGAAGRADLVFWTPPSETPRTLEAIEVKLFAVKDHGVVQAVRYAHELRRRVTKGCRVRSVLIAQEFTETARHAAIQHDVNLIRVEWTDDTRSDCQLRPI